MFKKLIACTVLVLILLSASCYSYQMLSVKDGFLYEVYEPQDVIPDDVLEEALKMYYEAYLYPRLHEGIPLKELKIDESKFCSYDEFILDMFIRDFDSYRNPNAVARHYFQVRQISDNRIVGVCAFLHLDKPGYYYKDHIGVHKDFRRRHIARHMIEEVIKMFEGFIEISLDTRIFNGPAQFLYDSAGFTKLEKHPNPAKQTVYYHYVLRQPK